jgi:glycerol-3-phosphate dehydrogenase
VWPLRFVIPHVPGLRPRWRIRAGLFFYDRLARFASGVRPSLPGSASVRLDLPPYDAGLRPGLRHGFAYADCRVDDARLVIENALDAERRGARIFVRTACVSAHRDGGLWRVRLDDGRTISARALVNAAGPWVKEVLARRLGVRSNLEVRLVRGSHIVLPALYAGPHAFVLQNDDGRVVFMIPFAGRYTVVGTTDAPHGGPDEPVRPTPEEVDYLLRAANRYLARAVRAEDVVWSYAGVRPLCDDGRADPSKVTRDYTLHLDEAGGAPVLSVFGGKITTYRALAEQALAKLARHFPGLKGGWTARTPLPGSDFGGASRAEAREAFFARYPALAPEVRRALFRRHGARADEVAGDGDMGEHFGGGLTARELAWFVAREWARQPEDVLWRRTKAGLLLAPEAQARVRAAMERLA